MCETKQRTSFYVEKDGSAVLTIGEDVHVDIDETAFRILREDGKICLVEGVDGGVNDKIIASEEVD